MLAAAVVLLVGAALGAGGWVLWAERSSQPATGDAATPDGSAALAPTPGPITIALAGDVTAHGALAERLAADPQGFVGPLAAVLAEADLAVVDLDAPLSADPAGAPDVAAAPPGVLGALRSAGIDVVSAANDRSLDLGTEGLLQAFTGEPDRSSVIGVGADEAAAYRPFVREVGGHTVAVIAATQLLDPDRIASDTAGPDQAGVASAKRVDRLVAEVEAAREVADTVVVYLHWGTTGEACPNASQQELAAALVDAGADIVAGPGAGRVQGAGRSSRAAVSYGLGHLLDPAPDDAETGVLLVRIDGREVLGLEWVPARIDGDGVPVPLAGDEAAAATSAWDERRACTDLTP